jgi:peroxiredoxin Q/BCP
MGKKKAVKKKAAKKKATAKKKAVAKNAGALPAVGTAAPAFTAAASGGRTVSLSAFRGKKVVVLYFYPKDDTPGCTKEACSFRDDWSALERAGIVVLGVSPDSAASHERFAKKYGLPFTLVADEDHAIAERYGVWQEKSMYGRTYMGIARTTFVIDKQGRIAHVFEQVKPEGHSGEVLDWVRENL